MAAHCNEPEATEFHILKWQILLQFFQRNKQKRERSQRIIKK
jgi:hypothetical protein